MERYDFEYEEVMDKISRHCPEALWTYYHCLHRVDKFGTVYFSKTDVDVDMSENWDHFRNNVKKLALENLLEWHPIDEGISVTLADWDEDIEE